MHPLKKYLLTAGVLLGLASCEKPGPGGFVPGDEVPEGEKTPLTLSVGLGEADASSKADTRASDGMLTKAITVKPDDDDRLGELPEGTALYMVMVSSKKDTSPEQVKYTVTRGVTGASNENKVSTISFAETGCTRYWDDTFARDAQIAVYAACSPGGTDVIQIGDAIKYPYTDADNKPIFPTSGAWSETEKGLTIANWSVSSAQTAETLKNEDLCYSNNISVHADGTNKDERLKFRSDLEQSDPNYRKFDKGHLCFYHALSKITFNIIQGDGFKDEEFKFNEGTNIKLTNFLTKNTVFDIPTGEFTGDFSGETINTIAQRETPAAITGCRFTLDALVMPTTDLSSTAKGDISLIIAHNQYDISKKDLLDRISVEDKSAHLTDGTKLKPGVHYIFTFRIGKTKVDKIDAAIVDWESVRADEMSPSNARIKLSLEERGDAVSTTESIGIYRAEDNPTDISDTHESYKWDSGYVGHGNTLSHSNSSWGLVTKWYWPDNRTFYHFRAVMPSTKVVAQSGAADPVSPDYVALSSAATVDNYVDVRWGAPFRDVAHNEVSDSFKFKYDLDKGFDQTLEDTGRNQLYQAIGPTEDRIKLTLFHLMCDVTFVIKSTVADDEVTLNDGTNKTTVELLNYHQEARVLMGTGKVETTGVAAEQTPMTFVEHTAKADSNPAQSKYHYYPVPQSLAGVKLRITTPDKNQYIVDMANVNKTSYSNKNFADPYTGGKVDKWYPGFRYTYTFTLRKTGVENLQATIVDWEDVTAGDDNVQIQ